MGLLLCSLPHGCALWVMFLDFSHLSTVIRFLLPTIQAALIPYSCCQIHVAYGAAVLAKQLTYCLQHGPPASDAAVHRYNHCKGSQHMPELSL